jgi:hypothetical protein
MLGPQTSSSAARYRYDRHHRSPTMQTQTCCSHLPRLLPSIEFGTAAAQPFLAAPLRASGWLEGCVDALESAILGPLARRR